MPDNRDFDPIGNWSSPSGYTITVRGDGTYHFCDQDNCRDGVYERPYGADSYAIILKDFFSLDNSERITDELSENNYFLGRITDIRPDFDFSVNLGISSNSLDGICNSLPCFYAGPLEKPYTGLTFTKS
jgi:hypothetical protein